MTLTDNVHRLVRPHLTMRPGGGLTNQQAILDQLANAGQPDKGGQRNSNEPGLPINTAAVDLWLEITDDVRIEEQARTGKPTGHIKHIITRWANETTPEWVPHLEHVTQDIIDRVETLLDPPPKRRPLGAPCYDCGREWVTSNDGERTPAVTIGVYNETGELRDLPDMDMTCANCNKTWQGNEMRWPLKVINNTEVSA